MTIGNRLKEERNKLGLSQEQLGLIGHVTKLTQLKYESDISYPTAKYLAEVSRIGIDVFYVLHGIRPELHITPEETELLQKFRQASPEVRKFMLSGVSSITVEQQINGDIHGDLVINNKNK